uniref:RabGAP/TBC domain-containing protein n=1 Tax=Solanum tuberosum TaxID=4113 RepID=M1BAC5_SOLTU
MAKNHVPDWLNNSLWSSRSPPPQQSLTPAKTSIDSEDMNRSTNSVVKSSVSTESSVNMPVPVPPPAVIRAEPRPVPPPSPKVEIIGPLNSSSSNCRSDGENGSSDSSTTTSGISSTEDISRQAQLSQELSRKIINLGEVRRLASQGIPDGPGIRAIVWKLLLGYLPTEKALWPTELAKKRPEYKQFKEELLMNPSEIARRLEKSASLENDGTGTDIEGKGVLSRSKVTQEEHPLSLGKSSIWNQFFQDTEIIEQIDRDDALRIILIIFAKLNPGIRYVQGMNEILAPLFYVFRNDPNEEDPAMAEADTFFCFVELLSGFRDNFCQQLDNSVVGIRSTITRLSQLLKEHDEELWRHLEVTTNVNPQFYAFRWITLLLTQEFNFPDSLLIWDTLLSDPEGPQETLLRICCAMLIIVRRRLLAGDFTSNLKLLQNYPSSNISHLLYVANKLRVKSAG